MDDKAKKKELGMYYTPLQYCEKAAELVRMAINRVPKDNDYIILDRCAGIGNLESVLSDEELSHCVLSTYDEKEYQILVDKLGNKVRYISTPMDSMSKEFVEDGYIRQYIDNPNCSVILLENPPFRAGNENITACEKKTNNASYVYMEMIKELKILPISNNSTAKEIVNQFIWSGFKYYLRNETDSYIIFSPIKYWKSLGLADYKMIEGFLFNRKHFDASPSAISCMLFANIEDKEIRSVNLEAVDIVDNELSVVETLKISKCYNTFEKLFDRRYKSSDIRTNIYCGSNGEMVSSKSQKCDGSSYCGDSIIGYLQPIGFSIDRKHINLTTCTFKSRRGFYLRKDNYLSKLPLFCAKKFPQDEWYEKDVYFTTSDCEEDYSKNDHFLKYCLIYTCLSKENKCLSFMGTDGRVYQNELCFDLNALAYKDLQTMYLNDDERALISLWYRILREAKATANYDFRWNYGVYQITKELNTYTVQKNRMRKYDYPILNGCLITLKMKLDAYYKKYIMPLMLGYELIK